MAFTLAKALGQARQAQCSHGILSELSRRVFPYKMQQLTTTVVFGFGFVIGLRYGEHSIQFFLLTVFPIYCVGKSTRPSDVRTYVPAESRMTPSLSQYTTLKVRP